MVRISIHLPEDLLDALRQRQIDVGITVAEQLRRYARLGLFADKPNAEVPQNVRTNS